MGDYPHYIEGRRELTGWMWLSRHKRVTASSSLDGFEPELAVDEDVRSWWSARTGGSDEWFQIDLGASEKIEALQINFADQDSQGQGISHHVYQYRIEGSLDGSHWRDLSDATRSGRNSPHAYLVLPHSGWARFVRIANIHSPDHGKFSLY